MPHEGVDRQSVGGAGNKRRYNGKTRTPTLGGIVKRQSAHSITVATIALILAIPRMGHAQDSQDYGPDTYVSIATAFIDAAENDDPDAVDAIMTPEAARFFPP